MPGGCTVESARGTACVLRRLGDQPARGHTRADPRNVHGGVQSVLCTNPRAPPSLVQPFSTTQRVAKHIRVRLTSEIAAIQPNGRTRHGRLELAPFGERLRRATCGEV